MLNPTDLKQKYKQLAALVPVSIVEQNIEWRWLEQERAFKFTFATFVAANMSVQTVLFSQRNVCPVHP